MTWNSDARGFAVVEKAIRQKHNGGGWLRRTGTQQSGAVPNFFALRRSQQCLKMACNSNAEIENDNESLKSSAISSESCNSQKQLLSDTISATSRQNGEQAGCEDEQMSEQDVSERRKSGMMDLKTNSSSPSTLQRPADELPRRNFQIPRKIKERKGCVLLILASAPANVSRRLKGIVCFIFHPLVHVKFASKMGVL